MRNSSPYGSASRSYIGFVCMLVLSISILAFTMPNKAKAMMANDKATAVQNINEEDGYSLPIVTLAIVNHTTVDLTANDDPGWMNTEPDTIGENPPNTWPTDDEHLMTINNTKDTGRTDIRNSRGRNSTPKLTAHLATRKTE
ncbi:unnamed protein product [Sphagnum jensenii]|uniref:Uncharacterized protein n=1 Tax=Sphagnum jensenii TaxID=128206 RepID=A0ABP0VAU6_9BRYO